MKSILIAIIFFILILSITTLFFFRGQFGKKETTVQTQLIPTPTIVEEMDTWTDQSEFSFSYPKNLQLNPHDEDQENYAHVELTSKDHEGNLIVWAKDTNSKDLEEWVKKERIEGALDSILGGEPAKKVLINGNSPKIITSVIREGYLYQIEVNLIDSSFWNRIYDVVSSSFKFVIPTSIRVVKETVDSGEEVYDGEEVIE